MSSVMQMWLRNQHRSSRKLNRIALGFTPLEDRTLLSLVAAFGFEEGTGLTVSDVSGLGHTGTISGASWTTSGKFGNALSFNGTSNWVTISDANDLDLTTAMTLEAWVNPTTVNSASRDVIYKGNDNYYLEATTTNGSLPAGGAIVGSSYAEAYGTATLPTNTWTHLAATFDGTTLRLYVNGAQVSSVAKAGSIVTSTNALQIGGDSIHGQYFAGLIDDVRVYNTALSQSEIATDMITPVGGGGSVSGPQAQVLDGSNIVSDGTGSIDLGRTDIGTAVTRSFTVRNLGSSALTLGTISLPSGFSLASDFGATTLAPGASTTFSVRLDALAPGTYSGTVSFATSDPNQNPFNFTITGTASLVLTLDDTAGGFSATSDWLSYVGVGYQNEIRYKQVGSGSEPASWTFSGLNPGGSIGSGPPGSRPPIGSPTRRTPYWMDRRRWVQLRSTSS